MSRRQMHAQPRADKWAVAEDIGAWIRRMTGEDFVPLAGFMALRRSELDTLWRAIQASGEGKIDDPR